MLTAQKKIYLLGFMGCGKSTIGKKLADQLSINFIDLDVYIEKKVGMEVSEIFSQMGENKFRKIETQSLIELLYISPLVIALGGGTPCYHDNHTLINNTGTSIYIEVEEKELYRRLKKESSHRPVIANSNGDANLRKSINSKLQERSHIYETAHHKINGNLSVDEIVNSIIDLINS